MSVVAIRRSLALALLLPAVAAHAAPALRFDLAPPPLERGMCLVARADQAPPDLPTAGESASGSARPEATGRPIDGSPPARGDWAGLARDTGYILGYQVLAYGILYAAPESVSNWSVEQKHNYDFGKWTSNVTHPQIDHDDFYINYILHPYWGSAYYFDARGRGFGRWGSFAYSFLASSLYEFGTEAFTEPASIQDIFVTPIGGALLGIALEGAWSELLAAGESRNWGQSVLLFLIDPIGRTNRGLDHLFGFASAPVTVRLLPLIRPASRGGTSAGLELSMQW
jgi:hypothetical protein